MRLTCAAAFQHGFRGLRLFHQLIPVACFRMQMDDWYDLCAPCVIRLVVLSWQPVTWFLTLGSLVMKRFPGDASRKMKDASDMIDAHWFKAHADAVRYGVRSYLKELKGQIATHGAQEAKAISTSSK
jgi:hypothetical protein